MLSCQAGHRGYSPRHRSVCPRGVLYAGCSTVLQERVAPLETHYRAWYICTDLGAKNQTIRPSTTWRVPRMGHCADAMVFSKQQLGPRRTCPRCRLSVAGVHCARPDCTSPARTTLPRLTPMYRSWCEEEGWYSPTAMHRVNIEATLCAATTGITKQQIRKCMVNVFVKGERV